MKKDVFSVKEKNIGVQLAYIEAGVLTILVSHIVAIIVLIFWGC